MRRSRTARTFKMRGMPYSTTSALLDELPDLDKEAGLGKVLRRLQEGLQGNFDHLHSEMTRFGTLFSEGEADRAYMTDLYEIHEHEHIVPGADTMRPEDWSAGTNTYIFPYAHGNIINSTFVDSYLDIQVMPIFVAENRHIDRLGFEVIFTPNPGGFLGYAESETWRFGIYNADGPGMLPYSLLCDAGVLGPVASGGLGNYEATIDVDLIGGRWYWIGHCLEVKDSGSSPQVPGWNTTPSLDGFGDWGYWVPFPQPEGIGGIGETTVSLIYNTGSPSGGPSAGAMRDPIADYSQYVDTPLYSDEGPVIYLRQA